uniref:DNA-directed RNA polymerase n=1 Tax=Cantharellus appalachiensis TaxID=409893 RepID=A0A2S0S442_9AGAM|nr:hypothetical protein [Cantharellus appalachiensis]AWA82119.1 hypothetical protein [Cantharellus appalachiensis]
MYFSRKNIINYIYYDLKKEQDKENKGNFLSIDDFYSSRKINNIIIIKLGDYFISLFTHDFSGKHQNIFERDISPGSYYDNSGYILKLNSEFVDDVKNNIIIKPSSLPMLCKPNDWSDTRFGGFLENEEQKNSIITGSVNHKHTTENKNSIYSAVNYLNSIKFNINTDLLNFIQNDGKYLLEILN